MAAASGKDRESGAIFASLLVVVAVALAIALGAQALVRHTEGTYRCQGQSVSRLGGQRAPSTDCRGSRAGRHSEVLPSAPSAEATRASRPEPQSSLEELGRALWRGLSREFGMSVEAAELGDVDGLRRDWAPYRERLADAVRDLGAEANVDIRAPAVLGLVTDAVLDERVPQWKTMDPRAVLASLREVAPRAPTDQYKSWTAEPVASLRRPLKRHGYLPIPRDTQVDILDRDAEYVGAFTLHALRGYFRDRDLPPDHWKTMTYGALIEALEDPN